MALLVDPYNSVTIRRPNVQIGTDHSQRLTYQQGSNENRESSERAPSDVSLPFLNTQNLTKTNSQEQRKTVGIVGFNPASVQANKPNTRFFAAGNEFINPRLSEDNQSGASVDSANRKRQYFIVYDSLKEKRDSTEHDSEITKKNSIKMNARLKVLRPTSKESNGSNGNTSKQSIRSVQASDQIDNMSRNTSIQSLGQKLHGKINTFERRYQRPVECHSPLLIGQNTTVHQQAKQKQDIEKRLNKVMINPSENASKVHLPKLGKPFDRASRDGGTKSEINQGDPYCRRRTADEEQARQPFLGNHQPRIMKQNVPYKPLSSHAATRPTNVQCPEDLNNLAVGRLNLKPESETKSLRKVELARYDSRNPRRRVVEEALDPLDDNLFFADFDSIPMNKNKSREQTEASKPSPASNKNHTDETNFESGSHGKLKAQYFDSFGKRGELNEMVLKDQTKESGIFNISESQQMNFTFGNSNFNKELFQNNSNVMKSSNSGMLLETVEEVTQRDTATIQSRFRDMPEFGHETPPESQKSQRLKIPIKIVSSASKLSEQNRGEPDRQRVVMKSNPLRPPKVTYTKPETSPFGPRVGGTPLISQLKPEKLELRKQNND